jgi:hypothetical protein
VLCDRSYSLLTFIAKHTLMNIEQELSLLNFSYYLKTHPDKTNDLAIDYYAKFLEQQSKIRDLERNCRELEAGKKELYADYELLRQELEKEQRRNITNGCDLHLRLPDFLPSNPHNYL